ncbi:MULTISPECIES: hypothetical protein [Campylobacter]|uniref:hypothetical protein n=1 Tax=Campylobacter TaxID=194 RepID=UPI000A3DE10D|nr:MULTISPECIES: hypothetical protein [Campylobacter]
MDLETSANLSLKGLNRIKAMEDALNILYSTIPLKPSSKLDDGVQVGIISLCDKLNDLISLARLNLALNALDGLSLVVDKQIQSEIDQLRCKLSSLQVHTQNL